MRKFEVPYNYSVDYLLKLQHMVPNLKDVTEFVYLPGFKEHTYETRQSSYLVEQPQTLEQYEAHINFIKSLGLPIGIVFQERKPIDVEILRYYTDKLDINEFIVYDDENAKRIKDLKPGAKCILSVTRCLSVNDIKTNDYSLYDRIVLDFRLNDLELIKSLPDKYKYVVIANCPCSKTMPVQVCHVHWSNSGHLPVELRKICHEKNDPRVRVNSLIPLDELKDWDDVVYGYKLQGRDILGEMLLHRVVPYLMGENYDVEMMKNWERDCLIRAQQINMQGRMYREKGIL